MAIEDRTKTQKEGKGEKFAEKAAGKAEKKPMPKRQEYGEDVKLVRILTVDIPGNKKVYAGLTRLRGVSWAFANAILKITGIDGRKKIEDLTESEIKAIMEFIAKPKVPTFLLNRRKDLYSGSDKHVYGADLNLQRDFDIKRLKKIKAYRGIRHAAGQPVRGQRTKSHFRKRNASVGVSKGGAKRA